MTKKYNQLIWYKNVHMEQRKSKRRNKMSQYNRKTQKMITFHDITKENTRNLIRIGQKVLIICIEY